MKKQIAISLLNLKNNDEEKFFENIKKFNSLKLDKNIEISLHFDIMDGKFVPNNGISFEKIKLAKENNMFIDVHLMVENPLEDGYIKEAILNGADRITVHYEIDNLKNTIDYLKKENVKIGLAIKPITTLDAIKDYIKDIDTLLIMSVEPGFGGQSYIKQTDEKITSARKKFKNINIEVDGGINFETIKAAFENDISCVVIGSYLTCDVQNIYSKIIALSIEYEIFSNTLKNNLKQVADKWYKVLDFYILNIFVKSDIYELRKFALLSAINMYENSQNEMLKQSIKIFADENLEYIQDEDLLKIIKELIK